MRVAYCTGFWCTNIGNAFFSLGVEYALKRILGEKNVTVVSDFQTYTTGYGKRLYIDRHQLEYISALDVDYIVLAGPVISKYFLYLWKDILTKLQQRGIGYIILSAGIMKLSDKESKEIESFFKICPPYAFSSRDEIAYERFGTFAKYGYNGICFSLFASDYYSPALLKDLSPYVVYNFDKIDEPIIWMAKNDNKEFSKEFEYEGNAYRIAYAKWITMLSAKTDRFTDALIYARSVFPTGKRENSFGNYNVIRTDHRFHPHFRSKIYRRDHTFVADLPYGYLNLYANAELTLSDRVHACAVTLAFGHSAMLFAKTDRHGLLERVGAEGICDRPVRLDMKRLEDEKSRQINWLKILLIGDK